jgi:hypothetical protein
MVMSAVADLLPVPDKPNILTDPTYLPSDFPVSVIAKRGLLDLLKQEVTLWHAYLRGRILDVHSVVQLLDATLHVKGEVRGQRPNTRMNTMYIDPIESRRDSIILDYNRVWARLAKLGEEYVGDFPVMKLADTRWLSTVGGRNVGDSHRQEGWAQTGAGPSQRLSVRVVERSDDDGVKESNAPLGESLHYPVDLS